MKKISLLGHGHGIGYAVVVKPQYGNLLLAQLDDWETALEEFGINIEFEAGSQEDVYDACIEFDEDEVNAIIEELNKRAKRR